MHWRDIKTLKHYIFLRIGAGFLTRLSGHIYDRAALYYFRARYHPNIRMTRARASMTRADLTSRALNTAKPNPVYKTAVGILPMADEHRKVKKDTPPRAAPAFIMGVGITGIILAITRVQKAIDGLRRRKS